ncbi:MAG: SufS family cysteine desulfurase [Candidatus Aenigmarchaeota archaeon]|nr:SufS family cysteine desulfurase [Candidatus Aenigmarchaeota archaeon]
MNAEKIRRDFPIFKRRINGRPLVFLDSASTSQKPVQVLDAMEDFYRNSNSNVHRPVYKISEEATEMYESAREKVARFVGARDHHVIFTNNCTEAINLVARGWAQRNVKRGESIVSSVMEHHSNIVPWQSLKGATLRFADVGDSGLLGDLPMDKKTRLVSLTHVSNVLGTVNDVKKIAKEAHENGALFMMDGAQSVPHMKVDVGKIGCDFLAFSGHKMLGPTGIGALVVRKDVADDMDPLLFGSGMIREVTLKGTTFADAPMKFETGTPNISGAVGLSAAIDYLEKVGMRNIERHGRSLTEIAMRSLGGMDKMKIYGPRKNRSDVLSFSLGDAHSHDVATILDDRGIAVRSGHHCAQPLMRRFGVGSMTRASFYLYNTVDEVRQLAEGLGESARVLKV